MRIVLIDFGARVFDVSLDSTDPLDVNEDVELGDAVLQKGSRVLVIFASANYDERRWADPKKFDVNRDAREHVAFERGTNICAGMHLAQLEMQSLLTAMLQQVDDINVGEAELAYNNVLHGFSNLPVRFN
jgi:cytochrome P450